MQRFVKVDGKVRTDATYPAGLMDVIDIDSTDEHFRLVYDAKGRFVTHRISKARASPDVAEHLPQAACCCKQVFSVCRVAKLLPGAIISIARPAGAMCTFWLAPAAAISWG